MHTVCAFANDIDNNGGGYIIIGIDDDRNAVGVEPDSVDRIRRELLGITNKIEPSCHIQTEYCPLDGKNVLVIWIPGGDDRPYKCPDNMSRGSAKSYYVRRLSSTVKADRLEIHELMEGSEIIPFETRINYESDLKNLQPLLVKDFLKSAGSSLYESMDRMPFEELCERMQLIGGPKESRRPMNFALLFFSEDPERFFPYAHIDLVIKPDPTGIGMTEQTIGGPIDRQIRTALGTIQNTVIAERVWKDFDTAESSRARNYPLKAIEEAVVNAVYHKDYRIPEPITISVLPDRIEITSAPGPFRTISDEDLSKGRLVSRRCRNRRIGDMLKAIGLAEGRNTGIPLMTEAMSLNGSGRPLFETDSERSFFTVVLPVSHDFLENPFERSPAKAAAHAGRRTREDIIAGIVFQLRDGPRPVKEISEAMGYKAVSPSFRGIISAMVSDGTLEYTEENTFSPRQKIKLKSREQRRSDSSPALIDHRVRHRAHAFYLGSHHIPVSDLRHTLGSARDEDVPLVQSHVAGYVGDKERNREYHVAGVPVLPYAAVDCQLQIQILDVDASDRDGLRHRTESIHAFAEIPGISGCAGLLLHIPGRDVVESRQMGHIGQRLRFGNVLGSSAEHQRQLHLMLDVGHSLRYDYSVTVSDDA